MRRAHLDTLSTALKLLNVNLSIAFLHDNTNIFVTSVYQSHISFKRKIGIKIVYFSRKNIRS